MIISRCKKILYTEKLEYPKWVALCRKLWESNIKSENENHCSYALKSICFV